ncbi:MAG: hypothetical protein A3F84_13640 [Candidatus Handelsmanbacteria bacterium RIFCSPLOWO2_12_FULL_64_10]|uniref:Amidohydrolase-related domain-containing protein n=1 Tax=Handelsmanbacteria sp. (strain RIFCSPLOWO2_12_FULL_64_10) TaxID=1817868 RepID=A0A1F6CMV6_HANXR|nr:MAG: hypothetical protein A3F84_13640 [Candidatus Handelsmanbacteria bacterium RIFCSPLOWO2_12_FULL_64_10]
MPINPTIREKVESTPLVDTHEHLIEESTRLAGPQPGGRFPCDDWAYLFYHYSLSDLISAGMTPEENARLFSMEAEPEEKWRIFEPYFERCRNTGYFQAVLRTIRDLYGEDRVDASSVGRITEKMRGMVQKGFYEEILRRRSNVASCQVNSLEGPLFMETEYPTLLYQDLSFVAMSTGLDLKKLSGESQLPAETLDQWHRIIDWYFERYGAKAVAVKNQSAYGRRLNYEKVPKEAAAPLFARHAKGEKLAEGEMKAVQDHLFRYCVQKATDYGLPVKLHTGYYAGANGMPLERLRQNAGDLCPILRDFPKTRFVLMHIGYPYQDEFIALGKQYTNATIDLCWAWIISPVASVRFLKEFLTTAPASKVFTFGGDYITAETVYGHSRIARMGIAQALTELVAEGWMTEREALATAERIMRGNAYEVFTKLKE